MRGYQPKSLASSSLSTTNACGSVLDYQTARRVDPCTLGPKQIRVGSVISSVQLVRNADDTQIYVLWLALLHVFGVNEDVWGGNAGGLQG